MRGSDHFEIGTVKAVVAADDMTEAHMVVPRGMVFSTDTYIPLDAVVRRAGDQVFVNLPRLVIAEMPWDKPPTRRERKEKYGLPAAQVTKIYRSRSPSAQAQTRMDSVESVRALVASARVPSYEPAEVHK